MKDEAILILIYKVVSLLSGLLITYLGHRLFVKGIFNEAGNLEATWKDKSLILKRAAPGTFFALFGAIVVSISLYKGMNFETKNSPGMPGESGLQNVPELPDSLKFASDTIKLK